MKTTLFLMFSGVLALIFAAPPPQARAEIPVSKLAGDVPSLAPILEGTIPAVVNIAARAKPQIVNEQNYADPFQDPFFDNPMFREFFRDSPLGQRHFGGRLPPRAPKQEDEAQSIGSGVIVDAGNGYILTNHHVVRNADDISVILNDKRTLKARFIGSDPETDIAVLQVEASGLTAIEMGDSDRLRVGDYVVAIGSPFGLSHSVTAGIVSALGRSNLGIEGYEDFIQTDASINPGNSGGALIDLHGNLIGINTAIFSRSGGNMGIGFSIPSNMAKTVMDQLITHGSVERGQIGITMQDITPDLAEALKLEEVSGVLVTTVVAGSPAENASLKNGDVITMANGQKIESGAQLRNIIGLKRVGDTIDIVLLRDGQQGQATLEIGKVQEAAPVTSELDVLQGAQFSPIPSDHPRYGEVKGVFIAQAEYGSRAWRYGLRAGDIVLSVNQKEVESVDDLVKNAADNNVLLMNLLRGNSSVFIVVRGR